MKISGAFIIETPCFWQWIKEGRLLMASLEYFVVKKYEYEWGKEPTGSLENLRPGDGFMEYWRNHGYACPNRRPFTPYYQHYKKINGVWLHEC